MKIIHFIQYFIAGGLSVLFLTHSALAADATAIEKYFQQLQSIDAAFEQTVVDSNGETLQHSKGRVWIERPGRFHWDYKTPYRQQIVSDGTRMWTWDEDLEQATVKKVDDALSSTPAMLLSGYRPLSEVATWKVLKSDDGKEWFVLSPIQTDSSVEQVRIGFSGKEISVIEVNDNFGNHTRIEFSSIRKNIEIDPALFIMDFPPGTDIIGDS